MDGRVAFLGDSLTHAGRWEEFFPNHEIANFGIPGETSAEITSRLEQVIEWKSEKVILMMGINDLGDGLGSGIILHHYKKIIERVQGLENVELIIQSLLPVNFQLFPTTNFQLGDILETNHQLKELCEKENITFVDLYPSFSTYANELIKEYTYDGVHLNEAGYRVWKNCLQSENLI